jgi:hypothetical protein
MKGHEIVLIDWMFVSVGCKAESLLICSVIHFPHQCCEIFFARLILIQDGVVRELAIFFIW